MSCEKCKIKRGNNDAEHQSTNGGDWCISNSFGDKKIHLAIWDKYMVHDIHLLEDIKYCPYCGGKIKHAKDFTSRQKLHKHLLWKAEHEHITYREAKRRWKKWWKTEGKAAAKARRKEMEKNEKTTQ